MIKYATNLPAGSPLEILPNNLVRKTWTTYNKEWFDYMEALINHFINHPNPKVVPVYNFFSYLDGEMLSKKSYSYSYDMMRCGILPQEDRRLIDLMGDLNERHGQGYQYLENDIVVPLAESNKKLYNFMMEVILENEYWDIHSGNILMNEDGDYCLIDLEGFMRLPLNDPRNNWITRL